ncbi:hypothetical protein L6452_04587 [Arctium lappa]|uniref:Uncharacterized protein n=1 Tax=Arctium lappa TaxID=4217 RepID=A0ACB9EDP3_ARCLA|nr:hypothetical protein L6452_04587 [Arctium lappa]
MLKVNLFFWNSIPSTGSDYLNCDKMHCVTPHFLVKFGQTRCGRLICYKILVFLAICFVKQKAEIQSAQPRDYRAVNSRFKTVLQAKRYQLASYHIQQSIFQTNELLTSSPTDPGYAHRANGLEDEISTMSP